MSQKLIVSTLTALVSLSTASTASAASLPNHLDLPEGKVERFYYTAGTKLY